MILQEKTGTIFVSVQGCASFPIIYCILLHCDANLSDCVNVKSVWSAYAWYTFKFLWNNSGITFKHVACKQDKGESEFTGLSNVLYQFGLKAS